MKRDKNRWKEHTPKEGDYYAPLEIYRCKDTYLHYHEEEKKMVSLRTRDFIRGKGGVQCFTLKVWGVKKKYKNPHKCIVISSGLI